MFSACEVFPGRKCHRGSLRSTDEQNTFFSTKETEMWPNMWFKNQSTWPWRDRDHKSRNLWSEAQDCFCREYLPVRTPHWKWQKSDANQLNHNYQDGEDEQIAVFGFTMLHINMNSFLLSWGERQNVLTSSNTLWRLWTLNGRRYWLLTAETMGIALIHTSSGVEAKVSSVLLPCSLFLISVFL